MVHDVKCKICELKGDYSIKDLVSEFHASRFLYISIRNKGKKKLNWTDSSASGYICRNCVYAVLDSLRVEQHHIDALYRPKIKAKGD